MIKNITNIYGQGPVNYMLEIRRCAGAEERLEAKKVSTIAFNGRHDYSQDGGGGAPDYPHDWYWGAFEDGRMVATAIDIKYVMRFDGGDAKMSGVSYVATLPEARRSGKIRRIFQSMLSEAYADGAVFSCLSPVSHAFYRQFGYEICGSRRRATLPLTEFSKLKRTGSYAQIFPGGDASGLRRVHEAYISDINHAVRRDTWPDDIAWHVFTSGDPYKTGCYLYLWRDDSGEPRSYIKFQHGRNQEKKKNEITVQELAFTGRESLYAALALTGSLTDMISDMVWEMPMFIDPADFVGDAWEVEQQIIPRDMTRIVNLRAALEQMRRPAGEGSYVIETEDQIIPENSGRWLVEYGPGTGRSRVARTQRDADLACDLPALAQLVTGYRTLASLLLSSRSRVELPRMGGADKLRGVFTLRPQHLTEYF